jgi:hypothetical protein
VLSIFSPEKSDGFGRVWTRELGYQRPARYLETTEAAKELHRNTKFEILTTVTVAIQEICCSILCQMLRSNSNIRTWLLQPCFLKYQKVCGVNSYFFVVLS